MSECRGLACRCGGVDLQGTSTSDTEAVTAYLNGLADAQANFVPSVTLPPLLFPPNATLRLTATAANWLGSIATASLTVHKAPVEVTAAVTLETTGGTALALSALEDFDRTQVLYATATATSTCPDIPVYATFDVAWEQVGATGGVVA